MSNYTVDNVYEQEPRPWPVVEREAAIEFATNAVSNVYIAANRAAEEQARREKQRRLFEQSTLLRHQAQHDHDQQLSLADELQESIERGDFDA